MVRRMESEGRRKVAGSKRVHVSDVLDGIDDGEENILANELRNGFSTEIQ